MRCKKKRLLQVRVARASTQPTSSPLLYQNLALADMVGLGDDGVFFHLLDQFGGFVVADAELVL
jgi:hypothetical protein